MDAVDYGLAAKCAQDQDNWREMQDKIFDEQNRLGNSYISLLLVNRDTSPELLGNYI